MSVLGVWVLPWFVAVRNLPIFSDSQALGFNNNAAQAALVLGSIALAAIAYFSGTRHRTFEGRATPVVTLSACDPEDRVSIPLIIGVSCAVAAMVAGMALLYRDSPFGDAAYFVDKVLQLVGGHRPFFDFEFTYGPLLLFPTYWLWIVLRPLGLDVFRSYYLVFAASDVLGLVMAAYLLNRLTMPRIWRNTCLALLGGFMLTFIGLGLNYTPVRFLVPFVMLLMVLGVSDRGWPSLVAGPFAAIALAFAVSPEMGVVTGASLAAAFALISFSGRATNWIGAAVSVAAAAAGLGVYRFLGGSTFDAFLSGANYFPVLPSQMSVAAILTILLAGWGVGATVDRRELHLAAPQVGWLIGSLFLVAAALGRADFVHLYWNALAALFLVSALLWSTHHRFAPAYPLYIGAVFIVAGVIYASAAMAPNALLSGMRSGSISAVKAAQIARRSGRNEVIASEAWAGAQVTNPTPDDMRMLIESRSVFALYPINGSLGMELALSGALAKSYAPPWTIFSRSQADREFSDMALAAYVLLPTADYEAYVTKQSAPESRTAEGMRLPTTQRDPASYAAMTGFPLRLSAARSAFDPDAEVGEALVTSWTVDRVSGSYTILRRNQPR